VGEKTTIWIDRQVAEELRKFGRTYEDGIRYLLIHRNPGGPREVKPLTVTVPPETFITRNENYITLGVDVVVRRVYIFFPDGCEDLVTCTVGAGNKEFITNVISGDNKRLSPEVNQFVPAKTPIWAEVRNEDTTYPHTPTIEVEIEKIREVGLV